MARWREPKAWVTPPVLSEPPRRTCKLSREAARWPVVLAALRFQVPGKPLPAAEGDLVAAAQRHREMAGVEQFGQALTKTLLGLFQGIASAHHIAGIEGRGLAMPGQRRQGGARMGLRGWPRPRG